MVTSGPIHDLGPCRVSARPAHASMPAPLSADRLVTIDPPDLDVAALTDHERGAERADDSEGAVDSG
jgi:hypothetical protein